MDKRIELGDEVEDIITKFKGIVTAIHIYIYGCVRMTVSSKSSQGSEPKNMSFDEPQLRIIKKKRQVKEFKPKEYTGGVDKYMDEGR